MPCALPPLSILRMQSRRSSSSRTIAKSTLSAGKIRALRTIGFHSNMPWSSHCIHNGVHAALVIIDIDMYDSSEVSPGCMLRMRATGASVNEIKYFFGASVSVSVDLRPGESHCKIAAIVRRLVLPSVVLNLIVARMKILAIAFDQKGAGRFGIIYCPIRTIDRPFKLRNKQ